MKGTNQSTRSEFWAAIGNYNGKRKQRGSRIYTGRTWENKTSYFYGAT